jgi:hypothetical protein
VCHLATGDMLRAAVAAKVFKLLPLSFIYIRYYVTINPLLVPPYARSS